MSTCNMERLRVVVEKGAPLRVVLHDGSVVAARLAVAEDLAETTVTGRTSHFSSCPKAAQFRKPKQGTLGFDREERS